MQIYILDDAMRRDTIVESYESMIWTERYSDYGDFQLDIAPNQVDPALRVQGTFLAMDKSNRVMYVDYAEETTTEEGVRIYRVTGKSLEAWLQERPNGYAAITTEGAPSPLTFTDVLPAALIRSLVDSICRNNTHFAGVDNFPYLQPVSSTPVSSIPEPADTISVQTDLDTLYNTVKSIADVYRLGFRIVRPLDDSKLYFEVWTGDDRSTGQTLNSPVIFSTDFDNLLDAKELVSTANYKNVAYVFGQNGSRVVYADEATVATAGFQRRVLIVNASDITTAAGPELVAQLDQRGKQELAKNRIVMGFDGQIPQKSSYVYGVNYNLGDIVEQRNDHGFVNLMRVTEQIFVSDKEGEKAYPTLTLDTLLTPGSWDSIPVNKTWDSFDTETWDSM